MFRHCLTTGKKRIRHSLSYYSASGYYAASCPLLGYIDKPRCRCNTEAVPTIQVGDLCNPIMRWKPILSLIAFFVLALFTSARAQSAVVWVCEGKACGTTYGYCCCISPGGCHNGCPEPGSTNRTEKSDTAGFANAGCECQMVLQSADPSTVPHAKVAAAFVSPPVILLETAVFPVPVFIIQSSVAPHADPRGPPPAQHLASSLSLRAPPQA